MKTLIRALVLALLLLAPASARPADAACAPVPYCLFAGCWYNLLNNEGFSGTTCTPDWSGASITTSNLCSNSAAAVLSQSTGTFTQNFYVPTDVVGTLDISLEFATIGTPASPYDRILLELYEGTSLRKRIVVYTEDSVTYCHREDFSFGTNTYAGKTLQLRVRGVYTTPGVSYHVNTVQVYAYY